MPEHETDTSSTGTPSTVELTELLISIVEGLPAQQQRLDEDYLRRLETARLLSRELAGKAPNPLQHLLVPSRWTLNHTDIEARVQLARGQRGALRLSTRPLNLAYARKYAHADFSEGQLRVVVERVTIEPHRRDLPTE